MLGDEAQPNEKNIEREKQNSLRMHMYVYVSNSIYLMWRRIEPRENKTVGFIKEKIKIHIVDMKNARRETERDRGDETRRANGSDMVIGQC